MTSTLSCQGLLAVRLGVSHPQGLCTSSTYEGRAAADEEMRTPDKRAQLCFLILTYFVCCSNILYTVPVKNRFAPPLLGTNISTFEDQSISHALPCVVMQDVDLSFET